MLCALLDLRHGSPDVYVSLVPQSGVEFCAGSDGGKPF